MNESLSLPNDQIAKRNIVILIAVQALIGSMIPVHFLLGGLAGKQIAPNIALATLPVSMTIVGGMIAAPILSRFMADYGRIYGFISATLIATIGLTISGYAINAGIFWLLCLGALMIGFYMSAQGLFRFAATDMASEEFRPKAISFTLLGGLAAAILGPTLVSEFSVPNMALPYFIMAATSVFTIGIYLFLRLPEPRAKAGTIIKHAPLGPVFRDRRIIAAMIITIASYATMNLMMTSTPLAVEGCGYSRTDSASVVRAHVFAMFFPSFFTGYLIKWLGLRPVIFIGIAILFSSSIVALMGVELMQFYVALILLGVGWNFGFIGGTTLLVTSIKDADISKRLQGVNDSIMWSLVAVASLSSGVLMNYFGDGGAQGWQYVNYAMLPILTLAMGLGIWLLRK